MEHKEHEHKLQRELRQGKAYVTPLTVDGDPIVWLKQRAKVGDILLLHQEDGVVWGKSHRDGDWVTSNDIAGYEHSPRLCVDRLWDARLFNERREILLWRDDKGAAPMKMAAARSSSRNGSTSHNCCGATMAGRR